MNRKLKRTALIINHIEMISEGLCGTEDRRKG